MFNQKSILILFIERNRFQLFGGTLTGVVTIDVPETIIRDFDVLQKDGFYTLIKQWVKQYNLTASDLVIVYSDASYFEKVFTSTENPQVETDILKFFDTIPFESIWTKVYPIPNGKRAVGVNKSLYEAIHQGFSLQGVSTRAVLPAFTLGTYATARMLDAGMSGHIIKNIDILVKQSLFDGTELVIPSGGKQDTTMSSQKKNKNLPLLLGVFGTLILILILVVIFRPQ